MEPTDDLFYKLQEFHILLRGLTLYPPIRTLNIRVEADVYEQGNKKNI